MSLAQTYDDDFLVRRSFRQLHGDQEKMAI